MTEIKVTNINEELSNVTFLEGRTPHSTGKELGKAFATLSAYEGGGVFAGCYSGESAWERHPAGDELVQILDGAAEITILTENNEQTFDLIKGSIIVVPKGLWHRFKASDGVTVLAAAPGDTDHSTASDPRN